ncbi:hypothetical protein CTRI78_v006490 [Colletotrichum trifolii]|uniref:Uncharacterized protein n=1 Tax=Colletotrichum trifolii TaxID=5466 RepID=A0A4R8RCE8_COLTR|nr:hypothetical protein CTRI78_v006490 [Colletotrichum trifolii]
MKGNLLFVLAFAASVLAQNDHENCHSSAAVVDTSPAPSPVYSTLAPPGAPSVDCGGNGAPSSNVPGCPGYTATASVKPTLVSSASENATPVIISPVPGTIHSTTTVTVKSEAPSAGGGSAKPSSAVTSAAGGGTGTAMPTASGGKHSETPASTEGSGAGTGAGSSTGAAATVTDAPASAGQTIRASFFTAFGVLLAMLLA